MSYKAHGGGQVTIKKEIPAEVIEKLADVFDEVSDSPDGGLWLTYYEDKNYYGDDVQDALNELAPYTKTGSIEFIDENGEAWRFRFHYGDMFEEKGNVVFERSCAGYKIIADLPLKKDESLVIGHNPKAVNPYVVWYCECGLEFNTGAYCNTYDEAMGVIAERIKTNKGWIMKEVV